MHKQGLRDWVLAVTILVVALVKWCVGLGGHSGQFSCQVLCRGTLMCMRRTGYAAHVWRL